MKLLKKSTEPAQKKPSLISRIRASAGRHASRHGAFSAGLTALAVAAVILFNILAAQLPESIKSFDMTNSGIYNITNTTVSLLTDMTEDVDILVLADKSGVDTRIVRFLDKYAGLSDRIHLEYQDPTIYPSLLNDYDAETGDVVVTCEATGRQEIFSLDDIIGFDEMSYYYYGSYVETDFDGEGLLTTAVDGVLNTASRKVYQTEGHGETILPDAAVELLGKSHLEIASVNLLTDGGIPEDCDLLLINAPTRDLADDELTAILEHLTAGGQVMYFMAGDDLSLTNFETLCAAYGMTVKAGYATDLRNYYQNNPYLFFPTISLATDATSGLSADSLLACYLSRGMTLTEPARETITTEAFLQTSEAGALLANGSVQEQGVFVLAAVATETLADGTTARLTVFGCDSPSNEDLNATFSNLDNHSLLVASITGGFDDISPISVEAVSLSEPYNTVTASGLWSLLFVLVLPAGLLICGFVRWLRRRKL